MRLLIAAGGTGGGVYPALATVSALQERSQLEGRLKVQWVGAQQGMEADLVQRAELPFVAIPGGAVVGVGPVRAAWNLFRLLGGIRHGLQIVRAFRPDVVLVTGGYTAVALAIVARVRGTPLAVYLPDIEPGRAVRFVARLATKVLVTAEDSRRYLPAVRVVVTGYPVRPELVQAMQVPAAEARVHFGLAAHMRTVLVFGGSRGARSLNNALLAGLPELLVDLEVQVIHVSGTLDWPDVQRRAKELPGGIQDRYRVYPYLHEEMGLAMAAADVAVSRAGAASLGELPIFGLVAILVPYPHAWRYQKVNADALQTRGAALCLNDEDLQAELVPTLRALLADEERLAAMQESSRALATPQAAMRIAEELLQLAGEPSPP